MNWLNFGHEMKIFKRNRDFSESSKDKPKTESDSIPYVPIFDKDGDAIIYFEDEEVIDGKVVEKKTSNVHMVFGTGTGDAAGLAPMMAIWGSIKAPFFTGGIGAWADFDNEWQRCIRMLEDGLGRAIGSDMKLEIFSNCLDQDNRQILQAKRAQGQNFQEIWEDFEKRYVRDSIEHHRNHWRNLILPVDGLTEDHVRWFRSEWDKRRVRVEDADAEEEYELLLQRIGAINAKIIMFEEVKRGRGKFVLKMARLGDF